MTMAPAGQVGTPRELRDFQRIQIHSVQAARINHPPALLRHSRHPIRQHTASRAKVIPGDHRVPLVQRTLLKRRDEFELRFVDHNGQAAAHAAQAAVAIDDLGEGLVEGYREADQVTVAGTGVGRHRGWSSEYDESMTSQTGECRTMNRQVYPDSRMLVNLEKGERLSGRGR